MGNRVEYVVDGYCVGDCRSIVELTADTARSPTPRWLLLTNVLLCSKLVPALVRVLPLRFPRIMRTRTTRTNSYELCGRRAPLPELVPLPGPSPKLVPPLVRVFPNKSCIKEKLVPFVPTRTNCVGGGPARRGLGEYANYRRCNQRKHDCTLQPQRHMFGSPPSSLEYRMKCMLMNIFLATLAAAAVYIAAPGYIVQRATFPDAAPWTCRIN